VDRTQKAEAVDVLHKSFQETESIIVTQYSGLTVAQITALRGQMRGNGAALKVAKNRLAQRALKGTRFEALAGLLKGPVAIAMSKDPVAAAKVASEFAKDNEKLIIIGGALGEKLLDVSAVEALAKLPSLDEMRASLLRLFLTPATRIATVLQAPAAQLARVTSAYAKKG
jgi:large subunit ribosomal protein L10